MNTLQAAFIQSMGRLSQTRLTCRSCGWSDDLAGPMYAVPSLTGVPAPPWEIVVVCQQHYDRWLREERPRLEGYKLT